MQELSRMDELKSMAVAIAVRFFFMINEILKFVTYGVMYYAQKLRCKFRLIIHKEKIFKQNNVLLWQN
jgi:hypothetical protein